MVRLCVFLLLFSTLSACAASPQVAKVMIGNEQSLNCSQLNDELLAAEYLKNDSRKEDRFRLRYMMPLTSIMSIWNINKAESAAIKRIEYVKDVMAAKGCSHSGAQHAQWQQQPLQTNNYNAQLSETSYNNVSYQNNNEFYQAPEKGFDRGNMHRANIDDNTYSNTGRYRPKNNPMSDHIAHSPSNEVLPWQHLPTTSLAPLGYQDNHVVENTYPQLQTNQTYHVTPSPYSAVSSNAQPTNDNNIMEGMIGSGSFGSPQDAALAEKAFQQGFNPPEASKVPMPNSSAMISQDKVLAPPPNYSPELEAKTYQGVFSP